jgi:hypothetical protein
MKLNFVRIAVVACALILACGVARGVALAADQSQPPAPAAQSPQPPPPLAPGAPGAPMMRWHERMHGGQMMSMGPGAPGGPCAGMMGGPMGIGMMENDPKLRVQMMQLQGEMMKKMGELMEQRAKELQSGK